jgi:hypothetical protein
MGSDLESAKPNPILFGRDTKEFIDFVLIGRYRASSDAVVLRAFGLLRAVIFAQLTTFVALFVYAITAGKV